MWQLGCVAVFLVLNSQELVFATDKVEAKCLQGPFHTATPVKNSSATFAECKPWNDHACCTPKFTAMLAANQTEVLYNFTWHRCGKLSSACERYWVHEECFYQCSPYIHQWRDPNKKGAVIGVPICSSYCDRWYEACKNDLICVENVLTDFNFTIHGHNFCPKDKPCITYEKMYGGGKALCEKMWGKSFTYQKEKLGATNCMVMWFAPPNQNAYVKKVVGGQVRNSGSLYGLLIFILLDFILFLY